MKKHILIIFLSLVSFFIYSQDIQEVYDKLHPDYYLLPKISPNQDFKNFCFYYCPPNTKVWIREIIGNSGAVRFIISIPDGKGFFYGRKGYKYAYSFYGPDSKPIRLHILKKNNQWQVED
jgi:hypothetical protein